MRQLVTNISNQGRGNVSKSGGGGLEVYNKRILSIYVLTPFSCVLLTLIALFQENEKLTSTDSKPIIRYLRRGGGGALSVL